MAVEENKCSSRKKPISICRVCNWGQTSYRFSSLSVWTVSDWTEEAASQEVLCCRRMTSWGACWGDVWVWPAGSGHHVGTGCQSNLRSPDSYLRRRQRGRTASGAPWRRHKSEATGPGTPAWSWNPSGSAGGKKPNLWLCQQWLRGRFGWSCGSGTGLGRKILKHEGIIVKSKTFMYSRLYWPPYFLTLSLLFKHGLCNKEMPAGFFFRQKRKPWRLLHLFAFAYLSIWIPPHLLPPQTHSIRKSIPLSETLCVYSVLLEFPDSLYLYILNPHL